MNLEKLTHFKCNNGNCDPQFERLEMNGHVVLSGDYYHDKIADQIRGFLAALDHLDIQYIIEKKSMECQFGCD